MTHPLVLGVTIIAQVQFVFLHENGADLDIDGM